MTSPSTHPLRELDHRGSDGIDVRLLWSETDGRVVVAVWDLKTGSHFVLDVREGERPLDVFQHPYAYAAWRGIDTDGRAEAWVATLPAA